MRKCSCLRRVIWLRLVFGEFGVVVGFFGVSFCLCLFWRLSRVLVSAGFLRRKLLMLKPKVGRRVCFVRG